MLMILNAGFGDPLPPSDLSLIRSLGYVGVRQDVPTAESAPLLVSNLLESGLIGIFVIPVANEGTCQEISHAVSRRASELGKSDMAILEAGNEEDLKGKRWANDPMGWASLVADVVFIARSHNPALRVVSGGVSSLSKHAMGWLYKSRVRDVVASVGYHQYRHTPPSTPLDGYSSRLDEFLSLREASGDCDTWMTETGWHTAKQSSGHWPCKKTWSYTDAEVAQFLRAEIEFNDNVGAQCFVTYQLNDGPDPSNGQDRFGIRTCEGELKPSAYIVEGT